MKHRMYNHVIATFSMFWRVLNKMIHEHERLYLTMPKKQLLSFKIGILKNFAIFTGEHLCWCIFLIK